MTSRAAICQTSTMGHTDVQATDAVAEPRPEALAPRELALEELPSADDRACGVAPDEKERRARRDEIAPPSSHLLEIGLGNASPCRIRRLSDICFLGVCPKDDGWCETKTDDKRAHGVFRVWEADLEVDT